MPLKRLDVMMALDGALGERKVRVDVQLLSPRVLVADNPKAGHGAGEDKDRDEKANEHAFTGHLDSQPCLVWSIRELK